MNENEIVSGATTPPPAKAPYTKWIIVGVAVLVVLYGVQYFLSPTRVTERMMESATGDAYDIDSDDGKITYTSENGDSVQIASGDDVRLPANWPDSLPIISGGKITYAGTVNSTEDRSGLMVSYTTNRSAAEVTEFYKSELATRGWKTEATTETGDGTVMSLSNETGGSVALYVVATESETTVSLTADLPK